MGAKVLVFPPFGTAHLIDITVIVAMSGGVDSSVTAKLLSEKVCRVKTLARPCP